MELQYKSASGRLIFKLTGDGSKDLFAQIAAVQDTFEAETCCGVCGCEDIKFQVRITGDKEYTYYELVCKNPTCRARFSFGQSRDQKSLFPKRTDDEKAKGDDGFYLPNRGWDKYTPPTQHQSKGY